MSKTAVRFPLADAAIKAGDALFALEPFVVRATIAGSIRRGIERVGDIDLVAEIDTETNPWVLSMAANALAQALGYYVPSSGERIVHFAPRGEELRPSIDLYIATAETWGITLLVRTGSAAHNIRLARRGQLRLPARRLAVSRGILDTADKVIASRTEEDCFAALGLEFIEPRDREAPELEHMVRQEDADGA